MKKFIYVLFSVLIVAAFVVAGTVIDAGLFAPGAVGLIIAEIPLAVRSVASSIVSVNATSVELLRRQAELVKILEPLSTKKSNEFTDQERTLWDEKHGDLEKVERDLRIALQQEEVLKRKAAIEGRDLSDQDKRDIALYSFRKLILAKVEDRDLDGIELEMHQEAVKEGRTSGKPIAGFGIPYMLLAHKPLSRASTGQNVTTDGSGGYLVQEEPLQYFQALRNKIVLPGLGAKFLTGLVGDIPLVSGGTFAASWLAEDGTDTTTVATLARVVMQPKRLQATGALSLQLLRQSTPDVEKYIQDELISAHALGYQLGAINGGGAPAPTGILNTSNIGSVVGGTNGLAPAWSHIVDLETKIWIANADGTAMAYLTNAKVRGKLKQIEKAANTAQFVWVGNEMNGYPAVVTNAVPSDLDKGTADGICSAIIFGDFSKLFLGQWGNLDVIVDPYTLKKKAEVEITVIGYGDCQILFPGAFAAMKDALTA